MIKSFTVLVLIVVSLIYFNNNSIQTNTIEPKFVPYEIHETLIDEEHHKAYSLKQIRLLILN